MLPARAATYLQCFTRCKFKSVVSKHTQSGSQPLLDVYGNKSVELIQVVFKFNLMLLLLWGRGVFTHSGCAELMAVHRPTSHYEYKRSVGAITRTPNLRVDSYLPRYLMPIIGRSSATNTNTTTRTSRASVSAISFISSHSVW